jgi:hypothetical protein
MFSVIVDYHNDLLGLLEQEIEENGDTLGLGSLTEILNKLADEEVSIVQIAQERMGVIALNEIDCQWIEQLSRASLENDNRRFAKSDTSLNFNFLYVQSYLIRSYLLLCRINYQHIRGKYQCYTKQQNSATTTADHDDDHDVCSRLTDEWNHLEYADLNQLHNEHRFLQRIANIARNSIEDFSTTNLSTFIRDSEYGHRFAEQFQEYRMKDFPLHQLDDVCRLYEKLINNYQHAFIDAPRLLRVPLSDTLSDELDQIFQSSFLPPSDEIDKDEFEKRVQTINEFLNELKRAENALGGELAQSLAETCQKWRIYSPIVQLIPGEIKCENYVPLCQKLNDLRSQLRKQANEIEEQSIQHWSAGFDGSAADQSIPNSFSVPWGTENQPDEEPFLVYTEPPSPVIEPPSPLPKKIPSQDSNSEDDIFLGPSRPTTPRPSTPVPQNESNDYVSRATLKIQSVVLPPSALFASSRSKVEASSIRTPRADFQITHSDNSTKGHMCRAENIHEQLRKIFSEKKYDPNSYAIIDKNHMSVDFTAKTTNGLLPIPSVKYSVIEKTILVPIILHFEQHQLDYSATPEAQISSILARFIIDRQLTFTSPDTYFNVYDQRGKYLPEDSPIGEIYRPEEHVPIRVQILRGESETSTFAEVTLTTDQGMCLSSVYIEKRRLILSFSCSIAN